MTQQSITVRHAAASDREAIERVLLDAYGQYEKVLPAPAGTLEAPALERGERRVDRLQRGDVRRARPEDGRAGDRLVERPPGRLHLGKLGNDSSSWTRSM